MISYSNPLGMPDSLAAVKSTYCLDFQMGLMRLWITSVKDGTKVDMAPGLSSLLAKL